jgi:hypothetical protein
MISNEDNNSRTNIPENDPSKPMNSKQEVENSPDEKTSQDFPGYPHYPANEDIMDQRTGSHRVDADLESMGTGPNASGVNQRFLAGQETERAQTNKLHRDDAEEETPGMDGNNSEIGLPQNVSNEDLSSPSDLPGTEIDEAAEKGSTNP